MKTKKQIENLEYTLVEGATANVHSAHYDGQDLYVRFGFGADDADVTGIGIYWGVSKEDFEAWARTFPEDVPNDNSFNKILTYPYEKLITYCSPTFKLNAKLEKEAAQSKKVEEEAARIA